MKKETVFLFFLILLVTFGCSKTEFLSVKPDQRLVVPNSLEDLRALLDRDADMNGIPNGDGLVPHLGEVGADDYYLLDNDFNNWLSPLFQQYYIWGDNVRTTDIVRDWDRPYLCVFYANVVLDHLSEYVPSEEELKTYDEIYGSALFYRSHAYFHLSQIFTPQYDEKTATDDLGLPLRLTSDVNEKMSRSTVKETYARMINDLSTAIPLLPTVDTYKERPTKQAGYALMARIFLVMGDYNQALNYADSCLSITNSLLDYNDLESSASFPFNNSAVKETEVLFTSGLINYHGGLLFTPVQPTRAKVDSALYYSYGEYDLRKTIFFREASPSGFRFKGSYFGQLDHFAGIAVDEILLIRAECFARLGFLQNAEKDMVNLLKNRFSRDFKGDYVPSEVKADTNLFLEFILRERRKQLVFRGVRWSDLRRLNKEHSNLELKRNVNGKKYVLLPNSAKYVYPIPESVLGFNPEMPQNDR